MKWSRDFLHENEAGIESVHITTFNVCKSLSNLLKMGRITQFDHLVTAADYEVTT